MIRQEYGNPSVIPGADARGLREGHDRARRAARLCLVGLVLWRRLRHRRAIPQQACRAGRHGDDPGRSTEPGSTAEPSSIDTISGRTPKRIGQDAETQPARDDEVAVVFDHMAIGVAIAEARRHQRRIAEQPDLPAMGMTRERQRDSPGHVGKYVRLVRQQDDGRAVSDFRQRPLEIVQPDEVLAVPAPCAGRSASWSARPAIQTPCPSFSIRTASFSSTGMPAASSALRAIVGPTPAFCADRSSHQSWLPRTDSTPSGAFRPDSAGAHSAESTHSVANRVPAT